MYNLQLQLRHATLTIPNDNLITSSKNCKIYKVTLLYFVFFAVRLL